MIDILLKIHQDSESIDFDEIWNNGIFIFDSNVLLDLYRLPESASTDLINVLRHEGFNRRIWVGFQVVLEFLNNRYEAISDQKNKFATVQALIKSTIHNYDEVFNSLIAELSKLKLKQRHSLIDPDKFITPSNIAAGKQFLENFIADLSLLEEKQSDVHDKDKIKDLILDIFSGKIGEGFTKKELEEIYKLGEKRYEAAIPPGYKDKSKTGSYLVKDREFIRKFGDLILWKEIIQKVKSDGATYAVLVTGDVKEDWWHEKSGKKLGPRKELLNEIYVEAPTLKAFYLYDTSSFLKYAKSTLNIDIQESSIKQTKDLIEKGRRNRVVHGDGLVYLAEALEAMTVAVSNLQVGINKSIYDLPPLRVSSFSLYTALTEIFVNAMQHGRENYLGIHAKDNGEIIVLRFRNKVSKGNLLTSSQMDALYQQPPDDYLSAKNRGIGLSSVRKALSDEGIDMHITVTEKDFVVELFIPKSKFSYDASETLFG